MSNDKCFRILVIDDNPATHHDFQQILITSPIQSAETESSHHPLPDFKITTATQGKEGLGEIQKAIAQKKPYALAFIDIKAPPEKEDLEIIKKIWQHDPNIQIVIFSAFPDHNGKAVIEHLGHKDNLLILKKPFDRVAVRQLACALTKKWQLANQTREHTSTLERRISERTQWLEDSLLVSRGTLESSNDGILVVGNNNQIIDHNNKFMEMWEIPENLFLAGNSQPIFEFISKKLRKKDLFLNLTSELGQNQEITKNEKFKSIDDRVFEINSHIYKLKKNIAGRIWNFRDVTKRAVMEEKIQFQATHDPLTGLANRVLLFDRIQRAIDQAARDHTIFGLLFFDLNRFKLINDSLGHAAGDALLKDVAGRLQMTMRKTDTLARIGGDEFIVVTSSLKQLADIEPFIHKLLANFDTSFEIKGHEFQISTSIGVALYPQDGKTPEKLLSNADAAMYSCKELGGNNFQYYSESFRVEHFENLDLQQDFQSALKNNEFFLCYQPQYDLISKRLKSIETLVRWRHPTKGVLLPIDFVPLAEELGFIIPLGEWVLSTACKQNKDWQNKGLPPIIIAVNMGAAQLKQANVVDRIKRILQEAELDPQYLELELTENVFITIVQKKDVIAELQKLGVKIALDGFGSGYSSLNYLRKINIDRLKIDKSFIGNIDKDPRDELIIEAIISMGQVLGFEVLAEGVENQEQVNFLSIKNCEKGQGYFLSRPLEQQQMEDLLENLNRK